LHSSRQNNHRRPARLSVSHALPNARGPGPPPRAYRDARTPHGSAAIRFVDYMLGLAAVLILHCRQSRDGSAVRFQLSGERENHPKHFITLQSMWTTAKAWGYVSHNLMEGVVLPDVKRVQRFFLSQREIQLILAKRESHTAHGMDLRRKLACEPASCAD